MTSLIEAKIPLLASIGRYLEHCRTIDEPFALPGSEERRTPRQYYEEVAAGTPLGERFAAHWSEGELPLIREFIDDPQATPDPDAPWFMDDAPMVEGKERYISTYDLYWEVVRRTRMGEHYRLAWGGMRLSEVRRMHEARRQQTK